MDEHNCSDQSGASYTRNRRPVKLVYQEACATRSDAAKREYVIKQMSRQEKETLFCED